MWNQPSPLNFQILEPNPTEVQDKYLGLPLINGRVAKNSSNILSLDENCSLNKKIPSAENNFGNFMQSIMLSNPPPPPQTTKHTHSTQGRVGTRLCISGLQYWAQLVFNKKFKNTSAHCRIQTCTPGKHNLIQVDSKLIET